MSYQKFALEAVAKEAIAEAQSASEKHATYHSLHEAYAVLAEEVDEFWDCVKMRTSDPRGRRESARKELVQVAAVALRALADWEKITA